MSDADSDARNRGGGERTDLLGSEVTMPADNYLDEGLNQADENRSVRTRARQEVGDLGIAIVGAISQINEGIRGHIESQHEATDGPPEEPSDD